MKKPKNNLKAAPISVIYLARFADGYESFELFAKNYGRYFAGCDHELVIIAKGFSKSTEVAAIAAFFSDATPTIIEVPDDIGLDIHAYMHAAKHLKSEFICCFNTHTAPNCDDWLKHLHTNITKSGIGLVGATASYESLYNSYKAVSLANYALQWPFQFNSNLIRHFNWLVQASAPATYLASRSLFYRLKRYIGDMLKKRPHLEQVKDLFPDVWAGAIGEYGNSLRAYRDFPKFPNPHIRSTAFMIRRAFFLKIPFDLDDKRKIACVRFESGHEGMSISILNKGLDILLVGANGVGYKMEEWPNSGAFRSNDQKNLLATDNQTRSFDNMCDGDKKTHLSMTWGEYDTQNSDPDVLGVAFQKHVDVKERVNFFKPLPNPKAEKFISIAIPTHNRQTLLMDSIQTILNQNYKNFEIVVFDNASKIPLAEALNALGDERIRYKRSETFLSVTESWNNAIDMAKGEYVTLIGDDDGLLPGFFERINALADHFGNPELIFSSLLQFMHPGVVPGKRPGYVASLPMADFLEDIDYPFVLDSETIERSVNNSLAMRRSFMFNMPAFCSKKSLLDKMRKHGAVLLSPFPDYYFSNIALTLADKVIAEPNPLAFQGVSKVSFGFNLMNGTLEKGFKALNHEVSGDLIYNQVSSYLLPGPRYNSEYIVTMAYVADVLNNAVQKPDYSHYRKTQIWYYIQSKKSILETINSDDGKTLFNKLNLTEKLWALKAILFYGLSKLLPHTFDRTYERFKKSISAYSWTAPQITYRFGDHLTLFEVYKDVENGTLYK